MLTFSTTVCITKVSKQETDAGARGFPEHGRDCNSPDAGYPGLSCLHRASSLHAVQVGMRPEGEEGAVLMAPYSVGILAPGQLLVLSEDGQL